MKILPCALLLFAASIACAAPNAKEIAARIDAEFLRIWKEQKLAPSRLSTDQEFLRRASLDIIGRIPRTTEILQFEQMTGKDKREQLIDKLLSSEERAEYAALVWGNVFVGRRDGLQGLQQIPFRNWVRDKFKANRPFSEIVTGILTANGMALNNPASVWTLQRKADPEMLASASARQFLGIQIQCAQCHDHPFANWKQTDFYQFAAHFARIKPERNPDVVLLVRERFRGELYLENDPEKGVMAPKVLGGDATTPKLGSRRGHLARWITGTENKQFAKAITNRVWGQLLGRGIVDPVDDFSEVNVATAPKVLTLLSAAFAESNYDMDFLTRAITLTKVYQLSSRASSNNKFDERYFSKAKLRPMNPEQLVASIVTSTGINENVTSNGLFKLLLTGVIRDFVTVFANMDETTEVTDFEGTVSQALMMMNSKHITNVTQFKGINALQRSLRSERTTEGRIRFLYRSTVSRDPTSRELTNMRSHFKRAGTDLEKLQVAEDLYWSLLNSAEFAFNH